LYNVRQFSVLGMSAVMRYVSVWLNMKHSERCRSNRSWPTLKYWWSST